MSRIFESTDYRPAIKDALREKKKLLGKAYSYENMAKACRVQRTYLSAVLNGNGHLNSDQVYAACKFLGLRENEYRFISVLHETQRSVFKDRLQKLRQEAAEIRQSSGKTEAHIPIPTVELSAELNNFYLDPYAQMILMFLTVDRYRKQPQLMREVLGVHDHVFQTSLKRIEAAGLITMLGGQIKVVSSDFHLPAKSPFQSTFRNHLRIHALDRVMQASSDDCYSLSVLFSSNETARKNIQKEFLKFLTFAQTESQKHSSDEIYQLNFDLLKWTKGAV